MRKAKRVFQRIAVVGAGGFGTAIAHYLAELPSERHGGVVLYGRDAVVIDSINSLHRHPSRFQDFHLSPKLIAVNSLSEALENADLVVLSIPAQHLRSLLRQAQPYLQPDIVLLNLAKGLEIDGLNTMSEITNQEMKSDFTFAVLSGPSFAHDVVRKNPIGLTLGCQQRNICHDLQMMLTTPIFDVKTTSDIRGVELGGALKNVFAIAVGMLIGCKTGDSLAGDLFTRSMVEIREIGLLLGGRWSTFSGRSGLGDLAISFTPASRNFRFGKIYAESYDANSPSAHENCFRTTIEQLGSRTIEGFDTLDAVYKISQRKQALTPIIQALWQVLYGYELTPTDLLSEIRKLDAQRYREGPNVLSILLHELVPHIWYRRLK